MTKTEFLDKFSEKTGLEKAKAELFMNTFIEVITDTLKQEGRFAIANFGTFSISDRKERQGRNPRTGEPLTIPACKVVKFSPGKQLKDSINN